MRLQAYNDNGTMKFRQVSGSMALDSLPVGTTIGYEGGVIPSGYLWADGSTFDVAKYPELYTLLGTDTLPELFDHDKRDTAYTNIRSEVGSTVQTAYEMPYDGDITFTGSGYSQSYCAVYVLKADGTTLDWSTSFAGSYDGSSASGGTALFLNKGDKFYAAANNSNRTLFIQARFYKKHLLIKAATIGIADISINAVKTALSYSTEETLTGGTWIDGKPIYRKAVPILSIGNVTGGQTMSIPFDRTTIKDVVNANTVFKNSSGYDYPHWGVVTSVDSNSIIIQWLNTGALSSGYIILEYTKQ